MSAFVFDFDGPLFDGRQAAATAFEKTAEHFRDRFGEPLVRFEALPLLRPRALVAAAFGHAVQQIGDLREMESFYRSELTQAEGMLAIDSHIRVALNALHVNGIPICILSSRREADLNGKLTTHGIKELFRCVVGRDSPMGPKSLVALQAIASELNVKPSAITVVGDTDEDYACAIGVGASYYHAGWSTEPTNRSLKDAHSVLHTPQQLADIVKSRHSITVHVRDEALPLELRQAIEDGALSFYAGAGVSAPSGIGQWDTHYLSVLNNLGGSFLTSEDLQLPEIVQLLVVDETLTHRVFDEFKQSFERPDATPNGYHYAMLRSGAGRIWTTNYDLLLENANTIGGFGRPVVKDDKRLLEEFRARGLIIKMNGDFESAEYRTDLEWNMVFTQQQFDLVEQRRTEIWRLFEDDYRNRCLVFVGVSFRDPALRRITTVARQKVPRTRYPHFLLAKRARDPVEERKQYLEAQNLKNHSIRTVFLEDFEDIEDFVLETTILSTRPVVGFSGSFGSIGYNGDLTGDAGDQRLPDGKLNAREASELCRSLGGSLAERGYRVSASSAPIVGIPAVSAAFRISPGLGRFYIREGGGVRYDSSAPAIVVPKGDGGQDVYARMRERFISELGLLVAIGGRIRPGKKSGVQTEIEMAMDRQVPVVIIPQAGGSAAAYAEKLLKNVSEKYPSHSLATAVRETNEAIASVPPAQIAEFARHELPRRLHALAKRLVATPCAFTGTTDNKW